MYEVVKVLWDQTGENNSSRIGRLVKLSKKHYYRKLMGREFNIKSTDHVIVAVAIVNDEIDGTLVHYEETAVVPVTSDGQAIDDNNNLLYFTTRALDVWEAMFAIGEI